MTTADVLGAALADSATGHPLLVERADGHLSTADLDWWLRRPGARPPADVAALDWITGETVIDVGCATGRPLEILAGRGLSAAGIDICPRAVELACAAGLAAQVADARCYQPPGPVDTALALGGGPGIAGSRATAAAFLGRLASWLTPSGALIVSSVDWRVGSRHQEWTRAATAQGRYPGDVTMRLRYGDMVGDWFTWVWLDPDTLSQVCADVGLVITRIHRWGSWYAATLRRPPR
jgi:cyclopropane fatty-acyl-phospholipid synthase-like methyltransferase